jgi:hypothetical protein
MAIEPCYYIRPKRFDVQPDDRWPKYNKLKE